MNRSIGYERDRELVQIIIALYTGERYKPEERQEFPLNEFYTQQLSRLLKVVKLYKMQCVIKYVEAASFLLWLLIQFLDAVHDYPFLLLVETFSVIS